MQKPPRVYLLAGPDAFRKKLYLDSQKENVRKQDLSFDWQIFYPPETRIREILDSARTFPLFKKVNFIIVKNIHKLCPSDKEILLEYVKKHKSPAATCLILESSNYPDNDDFHRRLSRHCVTKTFPPLKDKEIERWVRELLRAQRKKISHEALNLLTGNLGGDLVGLYNTINNLVIYAGEKDLITEQDVEKFTGGDIESSVFDLVDALADKNIQKALLILRSLLTENKNKSPQIIGLVNYHLSRIAKAKILIEEGLPPGEINRRLKVPYAKGKKFIAQVKNISFAAIKKMRQALLDTDFNIKTGKREAEMALEILLTRMHDQL